MPDRYLLDSTPLSLLCHPNGRLVDVREVRDWSRRRIAAGDDILLSDIADYEVRRELLRAKRTTSLRRLDELREGYRVVPVTGDILRRAAEFWAQARNLGHPTGPAEALDADVILAAQAEAEDAVVITSNVGHLSRFVEAPHWK